MAELGAGRYVFRDIATALATLSEPPDDPELPSDPDWIATLASSKAHYVENVHVLRRVAGLSATARRRRSSV